MHIQIHVQILICFYLSCLKRNISRQKRLTDTWKTTLISFPNQCRYMMCGINWSMLNLCCGKPWKGAFQNTAVYENIPCKWLCKTRMMKNNIILCIWYWQQLIVELGGRWLLIWPQAASGMALTGQNQAKTPLPVNTKCIDCKSCEVINICLLFGKRVTD